MLFIARFTDKPDIAERRAELLQEHFDWLAANDDKVLLAGSVRTDVGGDSLGGASWPLGRPGARIREPAGAFIPQLRL